MEFGDRELLASGVVGFFTPGMRLHAQLGRRIQPYALLGAGVGSTLNAELRAGPGLRIGTARETGFAMDYGGGIDFRIVGPLLLRGEIRNFALRNEGRWENRPVLLGGIGLQF